MLLSLLLAVVLIFSTNATAYASNKNNRGKGQEEQLVKAYENVMYYAYEKGIILDLSLETFIQEYEDSNCPNVNKYEKMYYDILLENQPDTNISLAFVGDGKWYYNTGTSLPNPANYSKYNLLNVLKKGDIIYEKKGGFGITGHIAIVEGRYYSSAHKQYYIRVVEAISDGVVRSVLEDTRIDDKGVSVLRVKGASNTVASKATDFCIGQLGKAYMLDFKKDTSPKEPDWYCSELVWAGYYIQGYNIETTGFYNEPGITPRDINNSSNTYNVNFK